jgi:opacity protein-like surface antigen
MSVLVGASVAQASTDFFVTAAVGQSRIHTNYASRYTDAARSAVPNSELSAHELYWSIGCGYAPADLLRVTAGYEDWGQATAPSAISTGAIYPLTVGAKGVYVSYAPIITIVPAISIDPDIGLLFSDIHIGTDFASATGISDANTRSGNSTRLRLGLGVSVHLSETLVVGIKYLQIDLPEATLKAGASFYTDKIRPHVIMLTGQYSF